jgi:hypothetical protein
MIAQEEMRRIEMDEQKEVHAAELKMNQEGYKKRAIYAVKNSSKLRAYQFSPLA